MAESAQPASPEESPQAARVRAAIAYAGLSDLEAAEVVGISKRQMSRYKNGRTQQGLSPEQLDKLSEKTRVPRPFFDVGWDVITEEPTVLERLEALEWKVGLRRPGDDGPPSPPGVSERSDGEPPSSAPSPPAERPEREPGASGDAR